MTFSGAVKLADLNDFLAPSQNCIKTEAVPIKKSQGSKIQFQPSSQQQQQQIKATSKPNLIKLTSNKKAAVSLSDCLACSGCITSAQTVLLQQQSVSQFYAAQSNPQNILTLSVSPQSIASLRVLFKHSNTSQTFCKISKFMKCNYKNVKRVFNCDCGIAISLLQSLNQFKDCLKKCYQQKSVDQQQKRNDDLKLPVISSECPGWVCYAEKTQGKQFFEYMSKIKGPQQINGILIKQFLKQRILGDEEEQKLQNKYIYNIAVMPCYDKKLQALHAQMIDGRKDVDLIITTGELLEILLQKGFDANWDNLIKIQDQDNNNYLLEQSQLNLSDKLLTVMQEPCGFKNLGQLFGQTSNGYSQFISRQFIKPQVNLEFKKIRKNNEDLKIFTVSNDMLKEQYKNFITGDLIFCKSYSFRNLTNLSKKIKIKKCQYSYIQMMACPSGCFNGGGQLKSQTRNPKELLQDIQIAMENEKNSDTETQQSHNLENFGFLLEELKAHGVYQFLKTNFKETQVDLNAFTISW